MSNHLKIIALLTLIFFVNILLFFFILTQLFEVGIAVLALLSYEVFFLNFLLYLLFFIFNLSTF